jgi:hypothetical protein
MYTIIGGDQKPYGPISQDQIIQWITEGRANGQTLCQAEGSTLWKPLGAFPEFTPALSAAGYSAVPGAPPPLAAGPPMAAAPEQGTNGMAITGFVLSLLGLTCCGPVVSLLGLIFSGLALAQINKRPGSKGRNLAIAGICLAVLGFILFAILFTSGFYRGFLKTFPRM